MKRLFTILLFQVCCLLCSAQVIINPVYDWTSIEVLHPHVDKVELKKDSTKIYCSVNYQESWSYTIPKTMFVENLKTKKKYQIIKCIGLPFEPEERIFSNGGTFHFVFCFPHIEGLQKFNLIEDASKDRFFNIYGIDISTCYPQVFEESDYKRFKNKSDFYKSSGDIIMFADFEEKELSAAQYIFGNRSYAARDCYYQLAQYYDEMGDYNKAIDFGKQSLECDSLQLGVENKEYPVYANTLGSLSQFYLHAGKDAESLKCIQKSIRIRRIIEDKQGYLNELIYLLLIGHSKDTIIKGISMVKKELENMPTFIDGNSISLVEIYKLMASRYYLIDSNKNAIDYCNKALFILDSNSQVRSESYADLLGLKCKCQRQGGDINGIIAVGKIAKELYESLNIKSLNYAEVLSNLSWAYSLLFDYEQSIQLETKAAEVYETAKDWISLAEVYNSICHYYSCSEKIDEAERYIKKAIDILNKYDYAGFYLKDFDLTGNTKRKNNVSFAAIKERVDINKANFYQTLAWIFQKKGEYDKAIETELERGDLIKGDYQMYAIHLMELSIFYLMNSQRNEALACAEQSGALLRNDKQIGTVLTKLQLSFIFFKANDIVKAIQYASESLLETQQRKDTENMITSLSFLSFYYWKNHNIKNAELYLSEGLDSLKLIVCREINKMTSQQKQRLWRKYEHNFQRYRDLVVQSERDGVLLSKLFNYVLFSKSLLLDTEIKGNDNTLERLEITWRDVQKKLSERDIAIEFISTIEDSIFSSYHALIIDKKSEFPRMITLFSESAIKEIKRTDSRSIIDIVCEQIWKPILSQYPMARNIYFSPDYILNIIPIEYYKIDSTKSLFDEYNVYRLSSTKELVMKHENKEYNRAVLYGGLDYNLLATSALCSTNGIIRGIAERGGFDPLYNTSKEIEEIADMLLKNNIRVDLYSGEKGTEDSFRGLSNKNVSMLHMATHGVYVDPECVGMRKQDDNFVFLETLNSENDPVKEDAFLTHSFLVMSGGNRLVQRHAINGSEDDGILTAKEISELNFRGLDLVVLSACDSALGDLDIEGVYGLQRGFKKAGVNTILMSLDKVDDEATRILMVEFYRNLMSGKTKRQSLKEAQQYLRKVDNGKYNDPKYWAAFIMLDGLN